MKKNVSNNEYYEEYKEKTLWNKKWNTSFNDFVLSLSFLLPLFQEGQLSVTGESMCTKYWLTA